MSDMRKHTKKCLGDVVVVSADNMKNAMEVWATTIKGTLDPQSITAAFERKGKGKVKLHTYCHSPYDPSYHPTLLL